MHISDLLSPGRYRCAEGVELSRICWFVHRSVGREIEGDGKPHRPSVARCGNDGVHKALHGAVDGTLVGQIGVKSSIVPVWGGWPSTVCLLMRHDVWVTSDDPERNDILRLEDDVRATSDDPERNDILRLDEVKRRKLMLINAY